MELAYARIALQKAVGWYLFDHARKVNLIDIAWYEKGGQMHDRLAIRFHVDERIPDTQLEAMGREPLQSQPILGIPTMVIEGKYYPQQWSWWGGGWRSRSNPRTGRADPLRGGLSISTEYYGSGTLGGIVRDRATPHREMILSNWHVLVTYWGARRGQRILQPGRDDGGTRADVIATLERDAMANNLDAAVALLNESRRLTNNQVDIGPVTGVDRAELGMAVEKSGRTSGRTFGRVTGIGGVQRFRYDRLERLIRNVVTIEERPSMRGEVSRGGDSGSWWINSTNRAAVGLHFAGGNDPERALALDMQAVLDALNVDLVI
jgi:endonuclease G